MFSTHIIGIMLVLSGIILSQMQITQSHTLEEKLSAYKWQKRVLLIVASSDTKADFIEQKNKLETKIAGVKDRELEVFYLIMESIPEVDKTFLRKTFKIDKEDFCIILIGKDGAEKRRSGKPLQVDDLFQTIDAMPMRQQEMKRKNK